MRQNFGKGTGMTRIAFALSAALLGVTVAVMVLRPTPRRAAFMPELVHLVDGPFTYRPAGEFRVGTTIVDAPVQYGAAPALDIMKYHVSEADYARCIADDACPAIATKGSAKQSQTGVNLSDATAYARWLSDKTGQKWRLPTDAEWMRLAGNRAADDPLQIDAKGADPSQRWLESYRREAAARGEADFAAYPQGHFGLNDLGVADIGGNVWEWTETCFQSGTLRADGTAVTIQSDYCGVRAVQGKHRAYVIDFIRDARSGGCGAGVPPDFLGFRLVRDAAAT